MSKLYNNVTLQKNIWNWPRFSRSVKKLEIIKKVPEVKQKQIVITI